LSRDAAVRNWEGKRRKPEPRYRREKKTGGKKNVGGRPFFNLNALSKKSEKGFVTKL